MEGKIETFTYNNTNQNFTALFEIVPIFFSRKFYWYTYTGRKTLWKHGSASKCILSVKLKEDAWMLEKAH